MNDEKQTGSIPIHQWTDESGRVLLVKCVEVGGQSHRGFQWPRSGSVRAPVSSREPTCESGGLFGWPWGLNLGGGKDPDYRGDWIVFASAPEDVIDLKGKAKAVGECQVLYYGTWHGALKYTRDERMRWIHANASGAASATGESGSASATGESGAASATGESGSASATGESGSASATGWRGAASATGWSGSASATGWRGSASATGWRGAASATGTRGAASLTGACGAIEVGPQAAGVVTAESFTWIAHPGAVVLHRWGTGLGEWAALTCEGVQDGARLEVIRGVVRATATAGTAAASSIARRTRGNG